VCPKKRENRGSDVDVCFLMTDFYLKRKSRSTGGEYVFLKLANLLKKDGYKVSIMYVRNYYHALMTICEDARLKSYVERESNKKFVERLQIKISLTSFGAILIFWLEMIIKKMSGIDDFQLLLGIKKIFVLSESIPEFSGSVLIASWWGLSYLLDYMQIDDKRTKKYYMIFHSEDDSTFSGDLSDIALNSYSLKLRKLCNTNDILMRFHEQNVKKFPLGIEHHIFKVTVPIENRSNHIIFQYREDKHKGMTYLFESLRTLKQMIPDLCVIAYGKERGTGMPDFVNFASSPSNLELAKMTNSAMIFILPSLIEGFSLSTLESMACGAVPVVTDCGGVTDYVESGVNGIIVPKGDAEAISQAVLELLQNIGLRLRMAENAIKTSKLYNYTNMYTSFKESIGLT